MSILLTVVVPVYKVEQYIRRCLDSLILNPELMSMMDVLIINDGTPDNSAEISREYVRKYPGTFRQIDKENAGHGSVWNLGLKEAYGKYTKFLDSDDWLENLDIMLQKLSCTDADLVITSVVCHDSDKRIGKLSIVDWEFDKVYDADKIDWIGNKTHKNCTFHHCAIYKTEILRQYLPLFLEKQPYDDVILGAAPIIGAKSLVAWDLEVYQYLMDRPGQSISSEVTKRNLPARIRVEQSTIDFIEKHPVPRQSTKYAYFRYKLPKYYSYGYRNLLDLYPSKDVKPFIVQWDEWVKSKNPGVRTGWMAAYRLMPFGMFYLFWKCYRKLRH